MDMYPTFLLTFAAFAVDLLEMGFKTFNDALPTLRWASTHPITLDICLTVLRQHGYFVHGHLHLQRLHRAQGFAGASAFGTLL